MHHQDRRCDTTGSATRRKPTQIVTNKKALQNYIAKIKKRGGFAKGTWIMAAKGIGGRVSGAAQRASRYRKADGSAVVKDGLKPAVSLVRRLDYMEEVLTDAAVGLALEHPAGPLRRALAVSLRPVREATKRRFRRAGLSLTSK